MECNAASPFQSSSGKRTRHNHQLQVPNEACCRQALDGQDTVLQLEAGLLLCRSRILRAVACIARVPLAIGTVHRPARVSPLTDQECGNLAVPEREVCHESRPG